VRPTRFLRRPLSALLAVGLTTAASFGALPQARAQAGAQNGGSFTPAQRAEIVSVVRNALKTDPSILADAIGALRSSEQQKEQADSEAAVQANRVAILTAPGATVIGNPDGRRTMVEFYDPRCPYCRKAVPDLDRLLEHDHEVRVVMRLIPILGPNSVLDAEAIEAAGLQGKYAPMQRALMSDSGAPGLDRINSVAGRVGLDVARLDRDMKSETVKSALQSNLDLAHAINLTGTPTFVIGKQVIPGAVSYDELRQALAQAS